jgi:demethylmenaquinone methyltransferase/2-methoxy-6-polyprenyl-1,4-benzoquinol methylase
MADGAPEAVAVRPRPDKHPDRIAAMFDAIATRYDFLNHLLSGGMDWYWRWRTVRALRLQPGEVVLDLCTGTCDLAVQAVRGGAARVLGIDFAGEMLRLGRRKLARRRLDDRVALVRADAMRIPLADGSVAAVTIAFGIRNVHAPEAACREMLRVLAPQGRVAVLEFAMPVTPLLRHAYVWYFRHVLPRIGRLVSKHRDAYDYLPASVGAFSEPREFAGMLAAVGFTGVRVVRLTFGVVYLYLGRRP